MNFYKSEYPAVYRGKVEYNQDPNNLGRCKIRVPAVFGNINYNSLPWARPVAPTPVGSGRGGFNIPEVGDIVWVLFEGANKNYPVYLGGTYSLKDLLVATDKVVFYIEEGNSIVYDKSSNTYTISIGGSSLTLSSSGISIIGDTSVKGNLSVEGDITISGDLQVSSDLKLDGAVSCDDLQVSSSQWIPGGSMDLDTMNAMSNQEFEEIMNNLEGPYGDWMQCVTTVKQAMASKGVSYNQAGSVTLELGSISMKVRTDCSGLVSAMVSLYTGQNILMSSRGYVSASELNGFQKVSTSDLKAGDICARNGHVEIYAYRENGVDYVYSGGSTKSLRAPGPTVKGNGSYDTVWRPVE